MRVLLINTSERIGGAAIAASRLMESLKNHGIKAKLLVRDKQTDQISVVSLDHNWRMVWKFVWERIVIWSANRFNKKNIFAVDIANTGTDITSLPEFQQADVIHLHWINQGMLSLKNIEKILASGKPVVWTMHDMWPCTGICHHARECTHYQQECHNCPFIHGGGGAEQAFAEEMERTYPNVTALYGKVRFAGEMDLIANLDCVVTMDSLVMHLASLVATPVVSVWGATHPGLGFLGYGVSSGNVLQADMACRPCSVFGNKPCRYGDYRCLKAVTPEMAARRVAEITGSLPECPGNG